MLLKLLVVLLPWSLKRLMLVKIYNYELAKSAYIGVSWVFPKMLKMEDHSRIGHLNVIVNLDSVQMAKHSIIERENWVTGYPISNSVHFNYKSDRVSKLIIGEHSAITKKHHIDCTDSISIGKYTTVAGYSSQFLTHSISIENGRQECLPIVIGNFCFVSTDCTILGGSKLPDYSVLGAKSLLNKCYVDKYMLYGGVPSIGLKSLSEHSRYFTRTEGFVL